MKKRKKIDAKAIQLFFCLNENVTKLLLSKNNFS